MEIFILPKKSRHLIFPFSIYFLEGVTIIGMFMENL